MTNTLLHCVYFVSMLKGIEGTSETLKEAYDGGVSKIESSPPSCEHKWVVFHVKPSKFPARAQGAAI